MLHTHHSSMLSGAGQALSRRGGAATASCSAAATPRAIAQQQHWTSAPCCQHHACSRSVPAAWQAFNAATRTSIRTLASAGQAEAATAAVRQPAQPLVDPPALVYAGVVFDMDGTLTVSNIDFVKMRELVKIPMGDLFTCLESFDSGEEIHTAMQTILQLEAEACQTLEAMPGLLELLGFLKDSGVRVGLVTRNTTDSVNAFFSLIGEEQRGVFDILLTREHPYVKPDKRALLHFAEEWEVQPWQLLMVGDSTEDIETGNAAGTATCLITGGGNEVGGAAAAPPPLGAVPTFSVASLGELKERLAARNTRLGYSAYAALPAAEAEEPSSNGAPPSMAGAPPEGLDFVDWLFQHRALNAAACSFPRVDGARFGIPPDAHPGDRVLHLQCGNGALSKMLFSSGLQVIGVDEDVSAARKRGIPAVELRPLHLAAGALQPELNALEGPHFNAVVYRSPAYVHGRKHPDADPLSSMWWHKESLQEIRRVLRPGGRLCVEAPAPDMQTLQEHLNHAGFVIMRLESIAVYLPHGEEGRVRLFACSDDCW